MSSSSEPSYLPFFVYGTLIPGQPNDHYWQDSIISAEEATLAPARLHDLGTFPMLVEPASSGKVDQPQRSEPGEDRVVGQLIAVEPGRYHPILAEIDRLEDFDPDNVDNSIYRRVVRHVSTESASPIPAWVYVGSERYAQAAPIVPGGNWIAYCSATKTEENMAAWWRTYGLDLLFGNFSDSE